MFLFRETYQNGKYMVQQTNKHPLQVVRATLWNSFPENKFEHSSENVSGGIALQ